MGRVLLAGAAVTAWASLAHAGGGSRKVTFETDPPGATIYFGDTDSAPVCQQTPCTVDAPLGDLVVIVRKDSFAPMIDQVEVKRGRGAQTFKYKLQGATATLVIDAPGAKGAEIRVDDEDKGKVPAKVEVSGDDAHHVVVSMGGKTLYDDFINVAIGESLEITPKAAGGASPAPTPPPDPETHPEPTGGAVHEEAPEPPHERFIALSAVLDVGFRSFHYVNGTGNNTRDLPSQTQSMVGGTLELWPFELAGSSLFRALELYAKFERSVASSPVEGASDITPLWSSLEASLRYRWVAADTIPIGISVGYARDQYGFEGAAATIARAPDCVYGSLRLAARVGYKMGALEPFAGVESRLVLDRGNFGMRFPGSTVSGYGASAGIALEKGGLSARVEGSLMRYGWTFDPAENTAAYQADAGNEAVNLITASLGFAY